MSNELVAEQTTVDAPAQGGGSPESAPKPDLLETGLKVMADDLDDYDAFKAERDDQRAYRRGDRSFYDVDRAAARDERWKRVFTEMEKATNDALQQASAGDIEERIREERIRAQADLRVELYEQQNPGFQQRIRDTVEVYGPLTEDAIGAIIASPESPQIIERILDFPEAIDALNQMPKRELELFVAQMEGALRFAGRAQPAPQPPKPKVVSSAPKPVQTVRGKAHQAGKTPDEMNYEEYRAWRGFGRRKG